MIQNTAIVLASASPRRRELLTQAGLKFQVITSDVEEKTEYIKPQDVVLDLAGHKCRAVADSIRKEDLKKTFSMEEGKSGLLIVSADTVVALEDTILGKPVDEEDALRSLMSLSGRTHEVYTGVACILLRRSPDESGLVESDSFSFFSKTEVKMYSFDEAEALDYIATGEPLDKAGSYGIQGIGERLVESINGDYNNVVGFPLSQFIKDLSMRGLLSFQK